jgi:predicted NACHT family NTPase
MSTRGTIPSTLSESLLLKKDVIDQAVALGGIILEKLRIQLSGSESLPSHKGNIDQILAISRRLVIRGNAGSGKSTLLQWLAVRSAGRSFTGPLAAWNNAIPFFVRLRERVDHSFPAPEEFPQLIAKTIVGTMPAGWVHRQLESGRALVLVDGVDELPQAKRDELLQSLTGLVRLPARPLHSSPPALLPLSRTISPPGRNGLPPRVSQTRHSSR